MGRKAVWSAVAVVLSLPGSVSAQAQTWQEVQVADIEQMKDKLIGLAEAFDAGDYAWSPMESGGSVGEVLGLAIAEANLFPTSWVVPSQAGHRSRWLR